MTLRRLWNATRVLSSYYLTRWTGKAIQWGKPMTLSFEPTTACNLRCPECPSGLRAFTRPTGNLKSDFFRRTVDQLHSHLIWLIFYFQGEPYINPEFLEMVRYARQKNLYTITSTNGHFLDDRNARRTVESGLDRIIISVDGTTQEVYEQYRVGGDLEKVLQGIRNLVKWKRDLKSGTPHIMVQFLVVRPNEHQIPELFEMARELGADEVRLKTAQLYDYRHGHDLMPTDERYARYRKQDDGTYEVKHVLNNHCWKLWHACVVTWDGKVAPCCFDKDVKHRMGDLREQPFDEVWTGAAYRDFRNRLMKGRDQIDICVNCSEGCRVWF
ncbi:MAG: radical SAM protein [Lewinellaceae bacterium]|nr:radical SAM protein [Lewinella sp.]MCB9280035.1 radical SAM protein [Lewinellaceae bacterium]